MAKRNRHEQFIKDEILLECPRYGARLFRINTGTGWQGNHKEWDGRSLTIHDPRPLVTVSGANPTKPYSGFSDLVGFTMVEITPDMVGKKVAVFTAIETKTTTNGATADQRQFIDMVLRSGGKAGVARSTADAQKIIESTPDESGDMPIIAT